IHAGETAQGDSSFAGAREMRAGRWLQTAGRNHITGGGPPPAPPSADEAGTLLGSFVCAPTQKPPAPAASRLRRVPASLVLPPPRGIRPIGPIRRIRLIRGRG